MDEGNGRINAAWQGLIAGDRNGGPTAMAMQLAQSLADCGRFDREDVLRRYQSWYHREGFDTGRVAAMVFERMRTASNCDAVMDVDAELAGMTAGCNPAHRALPLALFPEIAEDAANVEARLTHLHPLAGEVSSAYVELIRRIVTGQITPDNFDAGLQAVAIGRSPLIRDALSGHIHRPLDAGGFAPEVLRAAVYFVRNATSFDQALDSACEFAGPDNYCPVLVGAMAGGLWGTEALSARHLGHCRNSLISRARAISDALIGLG